MSWPISARTGNLRCRNLRSRTAAEVAKADFPSLFHPIFTAVVDHDPSREGPFVSTPLRQCSNVHAVSTPSQVACALHVPRQRCQSHGFHSLATFEMVCRSWPRTEVCPVVSVVAVSARVSRLIIPNISSRPRSCALLASIDATRGSRNPLYNHPVLNTSAMG